MITIFLSLLLNLFILSKLKLGTTFAEKFALAGLLSLGVSGVIPFFVGDVFDLGYYQSPEVIIFFNLVVLAISTIYARLKFKTPFLKGFFSNLSLSIFPLLIFIFGSLVFFKGSVTPIQGWDAMSMYDGRAKYILSGLKFTDLDFSQYDINPEKYYAGYPPMTSNLHIVVYLDKLASPMALYGLFLICYMLLVYEAIRKIGSIPTWLKILGFIAAGLNPTILIQTLVAYSNLPMLAFQFGATYCALAFIHSKEKSYIILSGILIAFSTWTRAIEPTFIAFFLSDLFLIFYVNRDQKSKLPKKTTVYTAITFIFLTNFLRIFWGTFISSNFGKINVISSNPVQLVISFVNAFTLTNLLDISIFIYSSMLSVRDFFVLFIMVGLIVIFRKSINLANAMFMYLILLVSLYLGIIIAGVILFSQVFPGWDLIGGSLLRTNIVILPIIILTTLSCFKEIVYESKK